MRPGILPFSSAAPAHRVRNTEKRTQSCESQCDNASALMSTPVATTPLVKALAASDISIHRNSRLSTLPSGHFDYQHAGKHRRIYTRYSARTRRAVPARDRLSRSRTDKLSRYFFRRRATSRASSRPRWRAGSPLGRASSAPHRGGSGAARRNPSGHPSCGAVRCARADAVCFG